MKFSFWLYVYFVQVHGTTDQGKWMLGENLNHKIGWGLLVMCRHREVWGYAPPRKMGWFSFFIRNCVRGTNNLLVYCMFYKIEILFFHSILSQSTYLSFALRVCTLIAFYSLEDLLFA